MHLAANSKNHSHFFTAPTVTQANMQIGALFHPQLRGRVRWLANAVWLGLVLFSLSVFVGTLPARYLGLRDEVAMETAVLEQFGVAADLLPGYVMTLDALAMSAYVLIGILIFWRKSGEWVGFFASLVLITVGIAITRPTDSLFFADPRLRVPLLLLFALATGAIYTLLFTFPDGRFVPRWTGWLVLLLVTYVASIYLAPALIMRPLRWPPPPISPVVLIALAGGAVAQIYRYRRVSSGPQRQQTKWIVYGLVIGATGLLGFRLVVPVLAPQVLQPSFEHLIYIVLGTPLVYASLILFPLTIGISILFYRLWDIDLLINRTLVYGSSTAILAGVYTASITLSQKLFVAFTGQQSDLAVVICTLIIVATFTPLKDHLQRVIDRRWKETPDAARRFKALAEQIHSRVSPVRPVQITARLLAEAVAGFNAKGGAMYWEQDGALKLIHDEGEWNGDAKATANLPSTGERVRHCVVALGARRNGKDYTEQDRQALQGIASVVAEAIEQDRLYR